MWTILDTVSRTVRLFRAWRPSEDSRHPFNQTAETWAHLVIRERVGSGSFGEVYCAWDPLLEREVALKIIRVPSPDRASAFHEARLLARIRHDGIVSVYGVADRDGAIGIWMEYLRGQTLAQIVKTLGTMGPHEAALTGRAVTRAVAAVHASKLLHRDIKAENIMRMSGGRIVLMDFGLGLEHMAALDTNELAGTPVYMAPELLNGGSATVSSDIYAIGALLFFLLSGAFPYSGSSLNELRAAHRSAQTSLLIDLRSDLPNALTRIVAKAIHPNPARRYATAGEFAADLEDFLTEKKRMFTRRRTITIVATAFAGTAGWIAFRFRPPYNALPEGALILIAPIGNTTADKQLDAITELFRRQVQQSARFRVVSEAEVNTTVERMGAAGPVTLDFTRAREVALRTGAALVAFGGISTLGGDIILTVNLEWINASSLDPHRRSVQSFTASNKNAIFAMVQQAADWLRTSVGETSEEMRTHDVPAQDVTTASWDALQLFSEAQALNYSRRTEDAILLLKRAVEEDPDFALAYMRLGDLLMTLDRNGEAINYWTIARSKLQTRKISRKEDLRIRAMYAFDTRDFRAADEVFRTWFVEFPNDYNALFYRTVPLLLMGRAEEALSNLLWLEKRQPTASWIPSMIAYSLLFLDRAADVEPYAQKTSRLGEPDAAILRRAAAAFQLKRFADVRKRILELRNLQPREWRIRSYYWESLLLSELGDYEAALRMADTGLSLPQWTGGETDRAKLYWARAGALYRLDRPKDVKETTAAMMELDNGPVFIGQAGALLADCNLTLEAGIMMRRLDSLQDTMVGQIERTRIRAHIFMAEKKWAEAKAAVESIYRKEPHALYQDSFLRLCQLSGSDKETGIHIAEQMMNLPAMLWYKTQFRRAGTRFEAIRWLAAKASEGPQRSAGEWLVSIRKQTM
ncbi:MAG TPA: protein kinase [Bryobacteraceae bacterium]|nr:protein kinase [Bryobacteraceae bacterium]